MVQQIEIFKCIPYCLCEHSGVYDAHMYDHTRDLSDGSRTCRWINTMAVTLSQQNVVIWAYGKREKRKTEKKIVTYSRGRGG